MSNVIPVNFHKNSKRKLPKQRVFYLGVYYAGPPMCQSLEKLWLKRRANNRWVLQQKVYGRVYEYDECDGNDLLSVREVKELFFKATNSKVVIGHGYDQYLEDQLRDTNIILSGGVDDIWQDTRTGKLVVVDYKSQANFKPLDPDSYLSDVYHEGYKIQMDFYSYLLTEMGFDVDPTAYFLVCNANRGADGFFGKMDFSETIIPYNWSTDWIPDRVQNMIDVMNSSAIPDSNPSCKNCAYAKQRAMFP